MTESDHNSSEEQGEARETSFSGAPADSPSDAFLRELAHVSVGELDLPVTKAPPIASQRFEIRRRIGSGGFGTVYEAFDRARGATVALKTTRRPGPGALYILKQEFRALSEICHENLVPLYELHTDGEQGFFTMELVAGVNVVEYVVRDGRFDEARLRDVLRQLALGLGFLHDAGKLHRDVKPSNVLVTEAGRVVLLDFGLVVDIAGAPSEVAGTPAYMAPEQAAGRAIGPAADCYAVGVVLYRLLAGRLPFEDPGARRDAPPRPGSLAPGVPEDLDKLCMDLLEQAPERRPSSAEMKARLSLRDGSVAPPEESVRREGSFVGRVAHLKELGDALAVARAGGTAVALVHGRSGMGKSALVQRFLEEQRSEAEDEVVLTGRCFEQESVPYKALDSLVDALSRHLLDKPERELAAILPPDAATLGRLFPVLRRLPGIGGEDGSAAEREGDPDLRTRAFAALRELLVRTARCRVLVIDDLHWGDLDSVSLLIELLRAPAPGLLLIASHRTEEIEHRDVVSALSEALAGELGHAVDVRRIEVGPLDPSEAEALSRSLVESDHASAAQRIAGIVAEGGGHPLLLAELSRQRTDDGLGRPGDLTAMLKARIDMLPEPARRLLEVIAFAGLPIDRGVAALAAATSVSASGEEEQKATALLRANRLVRIQRSPGREELLPYHDRIGIAVRSVLSEEASMDRHHRLALALELSGSAEPERLLNHFERAGRLARASEYAAIAAARAHEALAFDRAARLYRAALDLAPHDAKATRKLKASLGGALVGAGRPREAADALLAAAAFASPREALAQRQRAAEQLLSGGYVDDGLATLERILEEVRIAPPSSTARAFLTVAILGLRLRLRGLRFRERPEHAIPDDELLRVDACWCAAMGLGSVNPILGAEFQLRHLLLALEAGEVRRIARAISIHAALLSARGGRHREMEEALATVDALVQRLGDPHAIGFAALTRGMAANFGGDWRRARSLLRTSASILREHGAAWELDYASMQLTQNLWALGEIKELCKLAPPLVEEAVERGSRFAGVGLELTAGWIVELAADRPDRARHRVDAAIDRWSTRDFQIQHYRALGCRVRIALYSGDARAAFHLAEEGWPELRRSGLLRAPLIRADASYWRGLAAACTDGAASLRVATECARYLERHVTPWSAGPAALIRARLARRRGRIDEALSILEASETRANKNGAALAAAAVLRRRGEWMTGARGRELIARSDEWMESQGVKNPERMAAIMIGPSSL